MYAYNNMIKILPKSNAEAKFEIKFTLETL